MPNNDLHPHPGITMRRSDETRMTHPERSAPHPNPVMVSHGSENVARYSTHESAGALGLVCMIAMSFGLGTRFSEGWTFLALAVLTGAAIALVWYWIGRRRQNPARPSYTVPTAGGVLGSAAMLGIGVVMMRFHFLRLFLELVACAGGMIAILLHWVNRRNTFGSLLQPSGSSSRYNAN